MGQVQQSELHDCEINNRPADRADCCARYVKPGKPRRAQEDECGVEAFAPEPETESKIWDTKSASFSCGMKGSN